MMFNYSVNTFSEKERISVLFKEYDTLRAEIIARTTGSYQLLAVLAVLFAAILTWQSSHGTDLAFKVACGIFAISAIGFFGWTRRVINRLATRVKEIESEINKLAGRDLLKWERTRGGSVTGWGWKHPPKSD